MAPANLPEPPPLSQEFYLTNDTLHIARALLGVALCVREPDGSVLRARITETEAYLGAADKAAHSYRGRTPRTQVMFGPGGHAYVYLCYGLHNLFNVVTRPEGEGEAVLIRAVEPLQGLERMLPRRKLSQIQPRLSAGPANLSQALGISRADNALPLWGPRLWLAGEPNHIRQEAVACGPRIGVAYAGEHALLPYRFWLKDSPWVSKHK